MQEVSGTTPVPPATDPSERIAYEHAGSIWVMEANGLRAFELTSRVPDVKDENPAFRPRGGAVAFSSSRAGSPRIYLAGLDGTGMRPFTNPPEGADREPAWSADGNFLAFVREHSTGRRDIMVRAVKDDDSIERVLVRGNDDNQEVVGAPTWSPDGTSVVFAADRSEGVGTTLWRVGLDGPRLARVTSPQTSPWRQDVHPALSPDGELIAFASNRHARGEEDRADLDIYLFEVKSGRVLRLTRDQGVANEPSFSPDGRRLYFTSTRDAARAYATEIFVMSARGGVQNRVTRDEIPQNSCPSAALLK